MRAKKEYFFLLILLVVSFFLRFPSLFEPNWYGDEGIYQVIGKAIREGSLLYQGIWDNKPPLLYLIYALVNGDQFGARLLSLIFLLLSIIGFYLLASKLFKTPLPIFVSTSFFAILFSLPLLEGNIANAENFMLLPILFAAFLVIKATATNKKLRLFNFQLSTINYQLFLIGLLLSLAFLIKIVAIFDLAAFILFLAFVYLWKKINMREIKKFIVRILPLLGAFTLPIILTSIFFLSKGIFVDFFTATFSQNVGYVEYGNMLFIPQGLLILKLLLLGLFVTILFWKRRIFSKVQIFILLWLSFSLFNLFFAQRPWTHYLLVILPSFSLLFGTLFEDKTYRPVNVILILLVLSLIPNNFWIYGKTIFYYQNFLSFIREDKSLSSYQAFFAPHVERDYILAQFLKGRTGKNDNIFIWGDNPQIYVLSGKLPIGRFAVAYHMSFYPNAVFETKETIKQKKPKYIVLLKDISPYEEFLKGYKLAFIVADAQIYARSNFLP